MADEVNKISILLVDDDPGKLLAMEAILSDLGENVVRANSGKDALRCLLAQDFAVILLDINMPGMDGFETAELIRTHPSFRHTPLIFVTAFSDDFYAARSYSLGAVDFILTPIVPEALRTKVKVFVDLFRSTERIRRQADALRLRAAQLQKLAAASVAINGATSLDDMLRAINDAARDIVGAHVALTSARLRSRNGTTTPPESIITSSAFSASGEYAGWRAYPGALLGSGLSSQIASSGVPIRLTGAMLAAHPEWIEGLPPVRSWLAAPLIGPEGSIGGIQVVDKMEGVFSEDDEALLVQLAQMGSMAIQTYIYAEAREANRLKDLFLATLSHELRTPLNVIQGWTRLLAEDPTDGTAVARGLTVIERNVRAQMRLVEELLDVSRISAGKLRIEPRPTRLGLVVEAAVVAMRPSAHEKQVEIHASYGSEKTLVNIDPDRMQQVVVNLLSNAIKFTPPGGRVDVKIDESDAVELTVKDTGVGITREFLPLVFDRFQQADNSIRRRQGGLGLGLTVVRDIVALHGGRVDVSSDGRDKGATFVVRLPRAAEDVGEHSLTNGECEHPVADISGLDVVLVEDDADTREIMAKILVRHGAHVAAYASVDEGLEAIGRGMPNVVISDLAMPGRDGYDLIRDLRQRSAEHGGELPALALSAHASREERGRALEAGFDRHASKPIQTGELVAIVAELADGGVRPRQRVAT